jgi:type IV pilus modification protein PilV
MRILKTSPVRRIRGFSLIDVMIAVLVLATGMLALAALQGGLVRSSAETRSRSQAAAIAEGVLGGVRAQADASPTWYDTITTANWSAQLSDAGITNPVAGTYGETFTVTATVQRMVPSRDTAVCGTGNIPCFVAANNLATGETRRIGEYKRLTTNVGWTDAAGEAHSIQMVDIISSLPSANSEQLVNRDLDPGARRLGGPKVRIPVPDDAGIIPIAIGDGRDTAATNPKPELDTSFGTQDTKFDVLTYATADGAAEVQRRIETQAIACRCKYGPASDVETGATFFTTKVRPTVWNGTRYATPKTAESESITVPDAWGSDAVTQSPLCDDCCRDHHDPGGLGEKPKFSPYRTDHLHYRLNASNVHVEVLPTTTPAVDYMEACRMIRVDGIWRVASDTRLEHMSLLETKDFARSFVPSDVGTPSAVDRYENFVKEYLDDRVIPVATGGSPNVASLESANAINTPGTLLLQPTTADRRFLHNRALYLDYLVPSTRNFLASKLVNCPSATDPKITCLLPFLPFVSINTTEIAGWSVRPRVSGTPKISVSNVGGTFGAPNTEPRRGKISVLTGAVAGETDVAQLSMDRSNAGLNGSGAVDPTEAGDRLSDSQNFRFDTAAFVDADNDGAPDSIDNCPGLTNVGQADNDGDGRGNACDDDDDGDGFLDISDNCPLLDNPLQEDTDFDTGADPDGDGVRGDGIGNDCDPSEDLDGDSVKDGDDNCPMLENPDQKDSNGNGIGDECDKDQDADGVQDNRDNCPLVPNGPLAGPNDQLDSDGDGQGDACDSVSNTQINFAVNVAISGEDLAQISPKPLIGWTVGSGQTTCSGTFVPQATDTNPNPYACPNAIGPALDLLVGQYTRLLTVEVTSNSQKENNPCGAGKISTFKYCINNRVDSVTVNGTAVAPFAPTVTNNGRTSEQTKINLPNVPTGATVQVNMSLEQRRNLFTEGVGVGYTCDVNGNLQYNEASCQ